MAEIINTKSYKVRLKYVTPGYQIQNIYHYPAVLGVSLGNPIFRESVWPALLNWITHHFEKCEVILGDYLNRFNEQIFIGSIDKHQASLLALTKGDDLEELIQKKLNDLGYQNLSLKRWGDFYCEPEFQKKKENLMVNFKRNNIFRKEVELTCEAFFERKKRNGQLIKIPYDQARNLAINYLLEEMAFISFSSARGFNVSLYPGTQIQLLKSIAEKKIIGVDKNLANVIYVDLTTKKAS